MQLNVTEHDTHFFGHVVEVWASDEFQYGKVDTFSGYTVRECILMFINYYNLTEKHLMVWDSEKMEYIMKWNPEDWELIDIQEAQDE